MNHMALSSAKVPVAILGEIPQIAEAFAIDTPLRLAHFMAQCAHESAGFTVFSENLNYSETALHAVFGKYFPGTLASEYARDPVRIANRVYAHRMGNGDELSGDGWKYRGRGAIQLTGRQNYTRFRAIVADDVVAHPDLVATKYPLLSAAWFWDSRRLNDLADTGPTDAIVGDITRVVNGGYNGLADRVQRFHRFWSLLSAEGVA